MPIYFIWLLLSHHSKILMTQCHHTASTMFEWICVVLGIVSCSKSSPYFILLSFWYRYSSQCFSKIGIYRMLLVHSNSFQIYSQFTITFGLLKNRQWHIKHPSPQPFLKFWCTSWITAESALWADILNIELFPKTAKIEKLVWLPK